MICSLCWGGGGGGGYNIFYKDYYAYGQVMTMGMPWATAWVD